MPHHAQQAQAQHDLGQPQADVHRLRRAHSPGGGARRRRPGVPLPAGEVRAVMPVVAGVAAAVVVQRQPAVVPALLAPQPAAAPGQATVAAAPEAEVDSELAAAEDEEDDGQRQGLPEGPRALVGGVVLVVRPVEVEGEALRVAHGEAPQIRGRGREDDDEGGDGLGWVCLSWELVGG